MLIGPMTSRFASVSIMFRSTSSVWSSAGAHGGWDAVQAVREVLFGGLQRSGLLTFGVRREGGRPSWVLLELHIIYKKKKLTSTIIIII